MRPGALLGRLLGMRLRTERWGGVVHLRRPAALVYANRALMQRLGVSGSPLWTDAEPGPTDYTPHSAPVEVHWTLSRRCEQACAHCYTRSVPEAPAFDAARLAPAVEALAAAGVFHVALGGGEPLSEPRILEVARALRARGILPSTTTSGAPVTPELARRLGDFAQINVSLDAVSPAAGAGRGPGAFATADAALTHLQAAGIRAGINAVLTRHTFERLPELLAYARRRGVAEVELLRLKPVGRARDDYEGQRLTPEQGLRLASTVLRLARRFRLRVKLDCSLAPFVYHGDAGPPDARVLRFFRIHGCEAGDSLASLDERGRLAGCSFLPPLPGEAADLLLRGYADAPGLVRLRSFRTDAPEPCRSCPARTLCNGGCRAVAGGDAPDPECPRVLACAGGPGG